ncbi:MAG: 1-(5-phosphoribosyl)-5-[(5-phosphoribosylamino)methylideneamino]imidazole-4-carboxamide isomerase [Butyricicoccus sp.]|nr:1-(5-phosphoribosyl)-5-[(5-phosphoribosylamino)methylideneamino]imidazole-4-carboxamide isomerase [Butyricicoccus sp.]
MEIFPAIDLYEGQAVRLLKGDYAQKTVYSADPAAVAEGFKKAGARYIHLVDLEGARDGGTPNFDTISEIVRRSGLLAEAGGGIRDEATVEKYLSAGVFRVILGTAAVSDRALLASLLKKYGERIAVGVDVRDGRVAVKGWRELSTETLDGFCAKLQDMGVKTIICTDISKDGAMQGTNRELYKELSAKYAMDIVASGGVSTLDDVRTLRDMGLCGAILGRAIYTGGIDLAEAIEVCR